MYLFHRNVVFLVEKFAFSVEVLLRLRIHIFEILIQLLLTIHIFGLILFLFGWDFFSLLLEKSFLVKNSALLLKILHFRLKICLLWLRICIIFWKFRFFILILLSLVKKLEKFFGNINNHTLCSESICFNEDQLF